MYFAPPAVDNDYCACVRKRGTPSAASDSIDCAIAGRDDIGGVGVGLCHAGSPLQQDARARTIPLTRSQLTTPSTSHLRRAERASQRRARHDKRSLSPPLSCIHSTLQLPAACVYLYIIYATRTPVAPYIYIYIHR